MCEPSLSPGTAQAKNAWPSLLVFPLFLSCCLTLPATAQTNAPSIDILIQQLQDNKPSVRREAAHQLSRLGPLAKPAIPALIKALGDPERQVWSSAVMTLAAIGPDAVEAIPRLIDGLRREPTGYHHRSRQLWVRSAYALSRIGVPAIPPLLQALTDREASVRAGAAKAIGGIGPSAHPAILILVNALPDSDADVRQQAAEALGQIGSASAAALGDTLGSPNVQVRQGGILALAWLGPDAAPFAPRLVDLAKGDPEPAVRAQAIDTLSRIQHPAGDRAPLLVASLRDKDDSVRHAAINALLLLRPPETFCVPPLVALLRDQDPALRERAAQVLLRVGPPALPALRQLLEGQDATAQRTAEVLIRQIESAARPPTPSERPPPGS